MVDYMLNLMLISHRLSKQVKIGQVYLDLILYKVDSLKNKGLPVPELPEVSNIQVKTEKINGKIVCK